MQHIILCRFFYYMPFNSIVLWELIIRPANLYCYLVPIEIVYIWITLILLYSHYFYVALTIKYQCVTAVLQVWINWAYLDASTFDNLPWCSVLPLLKCGATKECWELVWTTNTTNIEVLHNIAVDETTMMNNLKNRNMCCADHLTRNTSVQHVTLVRTLQGRRQGTWGKVKHDKHVSIN